MHILTLSLAATLIDMGFFTLTYSFYFFLRTIASSTIKDKDLPFVSIIVPARNEEKKIARCIESLLAQDYPNFELVVIDDRSTDSTGEIIASYAERDTKLKFVKGKDAPVGWIGKCNALAHAVGYASGDWYAFTDADTCHKPNSIRDAVANAIQAKDDLVSFMPVQELGSFWERVIMPILLGSFLIGDPFQKVNDERAKRAYAYGQYILCRRSSYQAVGGHHAVRDEILEDHALARVFKEKGYRIAVGDGKTLYTVRMYTDLESMWLGWTKNLYSIIECNFFNLVAVIGMLYLTIIFPFYGLYIAGQALLSGDTSLEVFRIGALASMQLVLLILWYKKVNDHHKGVRWYDFFLCPLGAISCAVLYAHAAYLVISGTKVNWKGRRYAVNSQKTIRSENGSPKEAPLAQDARD